MINCRAFGEKVFFLRNSAQRAKHEDTLKFRPKFSPGFSPGENFFRRNFALGNFWRKATCLVCLWP